MNAFSGNSLRAWSPMPTGSGAIVVHRQLEDEFPWYRVRGFDPRRELFPPSLLGLRNRSAEIVHATPDHAALLAGRQQKLVITFHNFVLDRELRSHSNWMQRLHYATDLRWLTAAAIRRADVITAVSEFTAHKVREFAGRDIPVRVIPNGIDTSHFTPAGRQADHAGVRVLVSGNASRRKGTQWLDAVARRLPDDVSISCTMPDVRLREWGIDAANVQALEKRPLHEMPALYQQHDILFMPTVREGFGLAVAEAMACGLPVVASRNSTMPELVEEGAGGLLCATGDVDAYAAAITTLARDPGLRQRMGDFNRQRVLARYPLQRMLAGYRELFEELA